MWLLTSPFLITRLCSVSLVVRFLPVSLMQEAWQSERLILYTAPGLFLGSSLSLMLVSNWCSVVIGLWVMRILNGCRMCEMFSDMPFMYGIVAVVIVVLSLALVVVVGLWVLCWMKSSLYKRLIHDIKLHYYMLPPGLNHLLYFLTWWSAFTSYSAFCHWHRTKM